MIFVQAGIQWITLFENTVTEMLAGGRVATTRAPVCTFDLRIPRPNVEQEHINDNDRNDDRDNNCEKQNREFFGLFDGMISVAAKRQDVLQSRIIPGQQKQVRQKHECGDACSFKPQGMSQDKNVQDDWKVEERTEKRCSWNKQQSRCKHLADADERVVETRQV